MKPKKVVGKLRESGENLSPKWGREVVPNFDSRLGGKKLLF